MILLSMTIETKQNKKTHWYFLKWTNVKLRDLLKGNSMSCSYVRQCVTLQATLTFSHCVLFWLPKQHLTAICCTVQVKHELTVSMTQGTLKDKGMSLPFCPPLTSALYHYTPEKNICIYVVGSFF